MGLQGGDRDDAGGARPVVEHHGAAEALRELFAVGPGDHVEPRARREAEHDDDRLRRIVLGARRSVWMARRCGSANRGRFIWDALLAASSSPCPVLRRNDRQNSYDSARLVCSVTRRRRRPPGGQPDRCALPPVPRPVVELLPELGESPRIVVLAADRQRQRASRRAPRSARDDLHVAPQTPPGWSGPRGRGGGRAPGLLCESSRRCEARSHRWR